METNGGANNTSVIEQTITLDQSHSGIMSFGFAVRGGNNPATSGIDGFRVDILDDSGTV